MIRSRTRRAANWMQPLRVTLGARQGSAGALRLMLDHEVELAPVFHRGRPVGILPRSAAEFAVTHGIEASAGELVAGGAPHVERGAGVREILAAARGIAPGILIRDRNGPILGLLSRGILDSFWEEHRPEARAPSSARGLTSRLRLGWGGLPPRLGAIARSERLPLYLVGGASRDLIGAGSEADLDLVVIGPAGKLATAIASRLEGKVVLHERFGTACVTLPSGDRIDLVTSRRETYPSPAQLPIVAPAPLAGDLSRRDVTVNSIALRLDGAAFGRLRDDLGGVGDLSRRLLRVHHPLSLVEDPTRGIRIARLAARLGFSLAEETRLSLRILYRAGAFERLGGERLFHEIGRIADEPHPAKAIDALAGMGLLEVLAPGIAWGAAGRDRTARLFEGLRRWPLGSLPGLPPPPVLVLMTLSLEGGPAAGEALALRCRLRGEMLERCARLTAAHRELIRSLRRSTRPSRVARACESAPPEAVALAWAGREPDLRPALDDYLRRGRLLQPLSTGTTLRAMGLPPGPDYRIIHRALREAWLDGAIQDLEGERRMLRRLAGRRRPR